MKNIKINKDGFTLIELLAVIIILSVLMLIAVPGVLKLMDNSKKNAFVTQAQMIYKSATEQYIIDSTKSAEGVTYCKDIAGTTEGVKKLDLTGTNRVYYKIKIDAEGNVVSYHISNDVYSVKNTTSDKTDISTIESDSVKTGGNYEEVSCTE